MKSCYDNIQWVIQRNLTNTDDLAALKLGCDKIGVQHMNLTLFHLLINYLISTKTNKVSFTVPPLWDNWFIKIVTLIKVSYFIVECGCLNSAGFYAADISAIVSSVTDYFSKNTH